MPSFKINPSTGEMGYWTGNELIVLPKSMAKDTEGAQALLDQISQAKQPPKFTNIDPQQKATIEKLYAATRPTNPATTSANLEQSRKDLLGYGESPEGKQQYQQKLEEARQGIGALGTGFNDIMTDAGKIAQISKEMVPSVLGGAGAATLLRSQLRRPGMLSNIARRIGVGLGAGLGEEAAQLTGINPESDSAKLGALVGGVVAGPVRPNIPTPRNVPLEQARREANAVGLFNKGIEQKALAKQGYKSAVAAADIDTKTMLAPLEAAINKEASLQEAFSMPGAMQRELSPEEKTRQQLLGEMQRYVQNLGDHLTAYLKITKPVELPTSATPKPTGATGLASPSRVAIPSPGNLASESAIPNLPPTKPQEPSAFGTPVTAANKPATPAPGKVELKVRMDPTMQASENIVTDIQKLTRAAERAKDKAPDLYNEMRGAITELRAKFPDLEQATGSYAKFKGYERGTKIVRETQHPAARIRTELETGDMKNRFTPKEQNAIIRTAEKSEGIGPVLSAMIKSPIGRQFLKAGIAPDGKTISNAVLQLGTQFIARSTLQE